MGDTFSNIGPDTRIISNSTITERELEGEGFTFVSDAELDDRIARGGKAILRDKRIAAALRRYVQDGPEVPYSDEAIAIWADLREILAGE